MTERIDVRERLGRRELPPAEAMPSRPRRASGRAWRYVAAVTVVGTALIALGLSWAPMAEPPAPALEFGTQAPQPLAAEPPPAAEPAPIPKFAAAHMEPARDVLALLPAAGQPVADDGPAWMRNAVAVGAAGDRPMIAVVIDDLGLNRRNADRVAQLPGPLTLAFMTYAGGVAAQAEAARAAGHELLVHVPMAPENGHLTTGPNVLSPDLPADELARRIDWALSRFDGYVGINNHMGSRFTADARSMSVLFEQLHRRGLLFLDSRTTAATVADAMALRHDVPLVSRNIFLDNEFTADAVEIQLHKLEAEARRTGAAVAIGHPHAGTIDTLARWLPTLAARGFALVPVSAIARHNLNLEVAAKLFFGPEAPLDLPEERDALSP
jgi:polysaccharide deacetylase 2 family uncharacterized protein YibQ